MLMPISLPTATGFVPRATFYFQEGKAWVFGAGISRSDAINKQVVLKCLCLVWHVAGSSALHSHWLRVWLVTFVPSTLCYKKIFLQQSSNAKVLMGTPKIMLAIPLFWCSQTLKVRHCGFLHNLKKMHRNCHECALQQHGLPGNLKPKEREKWNSIWSASPWISSMLKYFILHFHWEPKPMLACEHILSSE